MEIKTILYIIIDLVSGILILLGSIAISIGLLDIENKKIKQEFRNRIKKIRKICNNIDIIIYGLLLIALGTYFYLLFPININKKLLELSGIYISTVLLLDKLCEIK